ncbi:hypothetical protein MUK42_05333, partial [Musa troglodytarum]
PALLLQRLAAEVRVPSKCRRITEAGAQHAWNLSSQAIIRHIEVHQSEIRASAEERIRRGHCQRGLTPGASKDWRANLEYRRRDGCRPKRHQRGAVGDIRRDITREIVLAEVELHESRKPGEVLWNGAGQVVVAKLDGEVGAVGQVRGDFAGRWDYAGEGVGGEVEDMQTP